MTPEQIQELSKLITAQLDGPPWWSYLLMLAFGAVGAFFGAYLKKKGENYATQEDFQEILDQQKQSTEAVEDIKQVLLSRSWVNQRQWEARERHFSKILRELAALEIATGYLYFTAKAAGPLPSGLQSLSDVAQERMNREMKNVDTGLTALAQAMGEAEMHLPADVVQSVRELLKQEYQINGVNPDHGLSLAGAWAVELGAVRRAVLAVAREDVGRLDSPV